MPMPVQRSNWGASGQQMAGAQRSATRTVARPQQSLITRIYINLRWFHHFVPLLGLFLILYGIYSMLLEPEEYLTSWTIIGGGALISYLAIYYNKTR